MGNRLAWLGMFCTAAAWTVALPFYEPAALWPAALFATVAVAAFFFALRADHGAPPFSAGIGIPPRKVLREALGLTGTILFAQGLVFGLSVFLFPYVHRVGIVSYPVFWILRSLGYDVALNAGGISLWTGQFPIAFSTNLEKLAVLPALLLLLGGVIGCLRGPRAPSGRGRRLFLACAALVVLLLLRFALLAGCWMEFEDPFQKFPLHVALFTDRRLLLLFLALLTVVLAKLLPLDLALGEAPEGVPLVNRRTLQAAALLGAGLLLLTGGFLFQDPGVKKNGRILIDDVHSQRWEKSTVPMGKYDFGGTPVYSYSNLIYLLRHYYEVEVNTDKALDRLDLEQYAVVILKTPASRYTEREIAATHEYVEKGGGLFLVGDHTNLLGMNTFLNTIASRYGYAFNFDSSNQFSSSFFSEYRTRFPWSHPTVMGLDYFTFLTSCTLSPPLFSERALVGFDVFSDPIDYSKPSFFGDIIIKPSDDFGVFTLGDAVKSGEGRVVLFTDSTVFSNFCLLVDNHERYFLNVMNFLNRKNRWGYRANGALAVAGVVCVALAWFRGRKQAGRLLRLSPAVTVLAVVAGGLAWGGANHWGYRPLAPKPSPVRVAFLNLHTEYYLPPGLGTPVFPFDTSFDTFFVTFQRLGLFPFSTRKMKDAMAAEAVVVINPVEPFSSGERQELLDYVKRGGKLLVMDTIYNRKPQIQTLLDAFGIDAVRTMQKIDFRGGRVERIVIEANQTPTVPAQQKTDQPQEAPKPQEAGAAPVAPAPQKTEVIVCSKDVGSGTIVVVSDSRLFSRAGIGGVLDPETPFSRELYSVVYGLVEENFRLKPALAYP